MIRSASRLLAAALSLCLVVPALAQVQPGQSPLSISKGGTGRASLTPNALLFGNGTSPVQMYGCTGFLVGTGTGAAPTCRAIVGTDLPNPSTSSLGGVQSKTCSASQWINTISTTGVPACTQPAAGDLSGGQAVTSANDTNVTVTLGGTPASAALKAFSMTMGWSGQLAVGRGGTGLSAGTSGGIPYFSSASVMASSGALTQYGVVLGGGAGGAPTSTAKGSAAQILIGQTAAPTWNDMTGDVTISASGVTAIGTNKVTNAQMRPAGALSLIGRSANSAGNVADISATAASDCVYRESGSALGCGTVATAGIANSAVTNAKLASMANNTFKGNVSGSTATPSDLTATQVTAALNGCVGDGGSGGTKGLAPAPGAGDAAAGKFLKADCTWAAPAGGGGGGMTATERQNFALSIIYQSKSMAEYRRLVGMFATGFKGANDTLNGVNSVASTGYSPDSTNGRYSPSTTPGSNQIPLMTAATTSGVTMSADSEFSGSFPAWQAGNRNASDFWSSTSTAFPHWLKADFGTGKTIASYTIQVRSDGSNAPAAWTFECSNDNSSWSTMDTQSGQTWTGGQLKTFNIASPASCRYYRINVSSGSDPSTLQIAEVTMLTASVANNMTLITTAQTTDASVTNNRILIEYDDTCGGCNSAALNTDLTAEVTCNGGTNWATATLSAVTSYSGTSTQRKVAETSDTACTSGTSFAARIKTLNSKFFYIHGVSNTVH